jgi:hypothetical protein
MRKTIDLISKPVSCFMKGNEAYLEREICMTVKYMAIYKCRENGYR